MKLCRTLLSFWRLWLMDLESCFFVHKHTSEHTYLWPTQWIVLFWGAQCMCMGGPAFPLKLSLQGMKILAWSIDLASTNTLQCSCHLKKGKYHHSLVVDSLAAALEKYSLFFLTVGAERQRNEYGHAFFFPLPDDTDLRLISTTSPDSFGPYWN